MTLRELAKSVRSEFTLNTRTDGAEYWSRAGSDDWIQELCHEAHGDLLPDDFRYEFIVDALDALSEEEDEDDARDALPEEIRTYRLIEWFGSHSNRWSAADEWMENNACDSSEFPSIITAIACAMREEQEEVFYSVLSSLQDRLEETDTEDDSEEE